MTPKMMQQFWALVESTQVSTLLQFDDSNLVKLLVQQFTDRQNLDAQSSGSLNSYVQAKLPLIRDTAEGRHSLGHSSH